MLNNREQMEFNTAPVRSLRKRVKHLPCRGGRWQVLTTKRVRVPRLCRETGPGRRHQAKARLRTSATAAGGSDPATDTVCCAGHHGSGHPQHDYQRDRSAASNVLASFVRETTKALRSPQGVCPAGPPSADIEVALSILGRRVEPTSLVLRSTVEGLTRPSALWSSMGGPPAGRRHGRVP